MIDASTSAAARNVKIHERPGESVLGRTKTILGLDVAKPKREDPLYLLIKRSVRNALDLEYAIRASELVSGDQMTQLRQLEGKLTQHLINLGASREEVEKECLLDFAWDALQVGYFMTRRHTRVFRHDIVQVLNKSASLVREEFSGDLFLLDIPAASYYRICDLLAGNNIPRLIERVKEGMKASSRLSKEDNVPLSEFVTNVREPIHLHPSFRYGMRQGDSFVAFAFEVDLCGEFDMPAWRRQLNEFQYQYALYRALSTESHDANTRALIQDFLEREQAGEQSQFDVPGLDSLMPLLTGLYCWDRYKRDGCTLTSTFDQAIGLYPVGVANMKLNYRKAAKRIEEMAARFRKVAGRKPAHAIRDPH